MNFTAFIKLLVVLLGVSGCSSLEEKYISKISNYPLSITRGKGLVESVKVTKGDTTYIAILDKEFELKILLSSTIEPDSASLESQIEKLYLGLIPITEQHKVDKYKTFISISIGQNYVVLEDVSLIRNEYIWQFPAVTTTTSLNDVGIYQEYNILEHSLNEGDYDDEENNNPQTTRSTQLHQQERDKSKRILIELSNLKKAIEKEFACQQNGECHVDIETEVASAQSIEKPDKKASN